MQALASPAQVALAASLPDIPETVISTSQLRSGMASAWVDKWPEWETAVIEDKGQPGEPMLFGRPHPFLLTLFAANPHWFCINVSPDSATAAAALLAEYRRSQPRLYGDIYHTLTTPAPAISHPDVRLLTDADMPLWLAAPPELRPVNADQTVRQRAAAAAIVNGRIVAIAHSYALSAAYGDVGVATLPAYRGRGLATAAATLVADWLQRNGRVPVWSCGEDNTASLHVAARLGFHPISRRLYLILNPQ